MENTKVKYNIRSLQNIKEIIGDWIEQTQDTISNAENADYPNEDRISNLEDRMNNLQESFDALEEITNS